MRGRHRKPQHLHLLHGTRGANRDELRPTRQPLVPPPYLSEAELDRWNAIVSSLPPGALVAADAQCVERAAISWALYRETTRRLATEKLLIAGRDDATVRNPLLIIQKQAAEELHRCGTELGLSPTARTRLGNPKPDADDPLEMLLGLSPKPV